jgi:hypothetical protein
MEINIGFNKYMDQYFEYKGQWGSPSRCGIRVIDTNDNKKLVIATEIYRQNPGTPVTEWCAPLATQILHWLEIPHTQFIFIEHTPDMGSKLSFYHETFDIVSFDWDGEKLINPRWKRLERHEVDAMLVR